MEIDNIKESFKRAGNAAKKFGLGVAAGTAMMLGVSCSQPNLAVESPVTMEQNFKPDEICDQLIKLITYDINLEDEFQVDEDKYTHVDTILANSIDFLNVQNKTSTELSNLYLAKIPTLNNQTEETSEDATDEPQDNSDDDITNRRKGFLGDNIADQVQDDDQSNISKTLSDWLQAVEAIKSSKDYTENSEIQSALEDADETTISGKVDVVRTYAQNFIIDTVADSEGFIKGSDRASQIKNSFTDMYKTMDTIHNTGNITRALTDQLKNNISNLASNLSKEKKFGSIEMCAGTVGKFAETYATQHYLNHLSAVGYQVEYLRGDANRAAQMEQGMIQ